MHHPSEGVNSLFILKYQVGSVLVKDYDKDIWEQEKGSSVTGALLQIAPLQLISNPASSAKSSAQLGTHRYLPMLLLPVSQV